MSPSYNLKPLPEGHYQGDYVMDLAILYSFKEGERYDPFNIFHLTYVKRGMPYIEYL